MMRDLKLITQLIDSIRKKDSVDDIEKNAGLRGRLDMRDKIANKYSKISEKLSIRRER